MPRFQVSRSIRINSSPEKVFRTVADYGTWTTWSPWLCAEPDADVQVTPDPSSVGSVYSWKGQVVGQGEIEHRQLEPPRHIQDEIRFLKPFRSRSDIAFDVQPDGQHTLLTWQMAGSLPWFMFWMRSQMEAFIQMDYDRGLKMLKEWIETGKILSKTTIHGIQSVGPLTVAGVRRTCSLRDIGPAMDQAFADARQTLMAHDLPIDGQAISVYHRFDLKAQTFDFTSGFSPGSSANSVPPDLARWSLPATQALRVEHLGSYDHLGNAWSAAYQVARYKRLKRSKISPFELYRNDPRRTDAAELCTDIFLPLR